MQAMKFFPNFLSSSVSSLLSIGKDTPPLSPGYSLSPESPDSPQDPLSPSPSGRTGIVSFFSEEKDPRPSKFYSEEYFMEFKTNEEVLANITLKLLNEEGNMANNFKNFVTHKHGYGYRGSRVYAVRPGEWCLMGDLLYESYNKHERDDSFHDRIWVDEKPFKKNPRIFKGDLRTLVKEQSREKESKGSLVALKSSIVLDEDLGLDERMVGPQFKILFRDSLSSSGRTFGQVIDGLDDLKKIGKCVLMNVEPNQRITISDCGQI